MRNDRTTDTDARAPSRRAVLGALAAAGALATGSSTAVAQDDATDDGAAALEIVAEFEPPALPENIAVDDAGTVYLSMGPSGEIRAVDPTGEEASVATIDTGDEGLALGITVHEDALYVANASSESETHGIWRVDPAGEADPERIAPLPADETMPNGIVPDPFVDAALLVTDHLGGAIWRVPLDGEPEPWLSHESLEPDTDAETPVGADGLAVYEGDVIVDNLNAGSVLRVPVEDGAASEPEPIAQAERLVGADGLTVDADGGIYVAVNAANEVVRVTPDGEIETLVDSGLDFPADVHFGTTSETDSQLYVANFAYGTFLADPEAAAPSLARLEVDGERYVPDAATDDGDDADDADDDPGSDDSDDDPSSNGGDDSADD